MSRNNGNDGYEDLSGEIDASVPVELGDTESILEEVIHTIASAPNVPLSSTPRIDPVSYTHLTLPTNREV